MDTKKIKLFHVLLVALAVMVVCAFKGWTWYTGGQIRWPQDAAIWILMPGTWGVTWIFLFLLLLQKDDWYRQPNKRWESLILSRLMVWGFQEIGYVPLYFIPDWLWWLVCTGIPVIYLYKLQKVWFQEAKAAWKATKGKKLTERLKELWTQPVMEKEFTSAPPLAPPASEGEKPALESVPTEPEKCPACGGMLGENGCFECGKPKPASKPATGLAPSSAPIQQVEQQAPTQPPPPKPSADLGPLDD